MTVCLRATARRRARQQRGASSTCGQSAALSSARQNTGMPGDQVPLGGVAEKALEGVDDLGGLLELGFVCRVGTWRRITPVRTRVGQDRQAQRERRGGRRPGTASRHGRLGRRDDGRARARVHVARACTCTHTSTLTHLKVPSHHRPCRPFWPRCAGERPARRPARRPPPAATAPASRRSRALPPP